MKYTKRRAWIGTEAEFDSLNPRLCLGETAYILDVSGNVTKIKYGRATGNYADIPFYAPGGPGGAVWGDITGDLSDQLDLQSALDSKSPTSHNHDGSYSLLGHTHSGVYEPANANIQTHVTAPHAPSNAQANADITKAEIEAKLTGIVSSHSHAGGGGEAFPVGAVFISVVATDPHNLLGYGTWVAIAAGRMLVGLDSGDTAFDTVEEVGGAKTHTLIEAEMPAHTHTQRRHATATGSLNGWTTATDASSSNPQNAGTLTTAPTGSGAAHNNLPPYFVVYMWKRTA